MEVPPLSSISQIDAPITNLTYNEKLIASRAVQGPIVPNFFEFSSSRDQATSYTGLRNDFKIDLIKEGNRILQGQIMYPFRNKMDLEYSTVLPFFYNGTEGDPNININANLIGTPLGVTTLEDPKLTYTRNILKLKEMQANESVSYDNYLKELYLTNTEKGANYYINQLDSLDQGLSNYSRRKRSLQKSVEDIQFTKQIPYGDLTKIPRNNYPISSYTKKLNEKNDTRKSVRFETISPYTYSNSRANKFLAHAPTQNNIHSHHSDFYDHNYSILSSNHSRRSSIHDFSLGDNNDGEVSIVSGITNLDEEFEDEQDDNGNTNFIENPATEIQIPTDINTYNEEIVNEITGETDQNSVYSQSIAESFHTAESTKSQLGLKELLSPDAKESFSQVANQFERPITESIQSTPSSNSITFEQVLDQGTERKTVDVEESNREWESIDRLHRGVGERIGSLNMKIKELESRRKSRGATSGKTDSESTVASSFFASTPTRLKFTPEKDATPIPNNRLENTKPTFRDDETDLGTVATEDYFVLNTRDNTLSESLTLGQLAKQLKRQGRLSDKGVYKKRDGTLMTSREQYEYNDHKMKRAEERIGKLSFV